MKTYFSIRRNYASNAFKLVLNYSLDKVPDTLVLNKPQPTPIYFLENFSYSKSGGDKIEDMAANNLGWRIFSSRIANVFQKCNNINDIELIPLPEKAVQLDQELKTYKVLGVKREVGCVNYEDSEILWDSAHNHISSFRECVLHERSIPANFDVFLIAEYPVMPIISSGLAMKLAELHPTGFVFEKICAV